MDTSEGSVPQGANGVIKTTQESPTLNSKTGHVASHSHLNSNDATATVTSSPAAASTSSFFPSVPQMNVPISSQSQLAIPSNNVKVSVTQKPQSLNHSSPPIPNHNPIMRPPNQPALPNFTPPTPLVTDTLTLLLGIAS